MSTKMNLTYILRLVIFLISLRAGGIASSSFILFFYLYWYSYIVYFVCDSASEFGAMGSTSFLEFFNPNLLLVFLNLLFFRNLSIYFIFLPVLVFLYSRRSILFLTQLPSLERWALLPFWGFPHLYTSISKLI